MRPGAVALLAISMFACKVDKPDDKPDKPASEPRAGSATPSVPIAKLVPNIDGAKLLQNQARSDSQTIVRWCIDEPDATRRVMATLTREGWTDVAQRGTGDRIGVAASKADARFSATISAGSHDDCAGSLVTGTIARLGTLRVPAVEDRVR